MQSTDRLTTDPHASPAGALFNRRVLVVEDEALIAMMLSDDLAEAGATVIGPAASVGTALQLIEQAAGDGGLDAAVLDLNLGGEMVKPVADHLAAHGVPFLFATGYGVGCDLMGHGGRQVLQKPFDADQLLDAVSALTQPSRAVA